MPVLLNQYYITLSLNTIEYSHIFHDSHSFNKNLNQLKGNKVNNTYYYASSKNFSAIFSLHQN